MPDTSSTQLLLLSALKVVTLGLGFVIVYLGLKAWRASRSRPMFWLTVGMAVMSLGVLSEGVAYQGLGWTLAESHLFEAVVTLVAFVVLVWSLYV